MTVRWNLTLYTSRSATRIMLRNSRGAHGWTIYQDYQKLRLLVSGDDELGTGSARFADLAWGTIMVGQDDEGLSTPYPNVIQLDHPGLPALDESHIPALLVEVDNDVVSGEIVTVSNQLSMGPPGSGLPPHRHRRRAASDGA